MKLRNIAVFTIMVIGIMLTGCSPKHTTNVNGGRATVLPRVEQYDRFTMDLDTEPIQYTIDVLSQDGRMKLNKLSQYEAENLVLLEAIMANRCATLFQPQFKSVVERGKILRITVYGFPARYKKVTK